MADYIEVKTLAGDLVAYLTPAADAISAYIDNELNGPCTLTFDLPRTSDKWTYINAGHKFVVDGREFVLVRPGEDTVTSAREDGKIIDSVNAHESWILLDKEVVSVSSDGTSPDFGIVAIYREDSGSGGYDPGSAGSALSYLLDASASGWTVGTVDVTGTHDLETDKISLLANIQQVQETWGGLLVWDSVAKTVSLRDEATWQPYSGFGILYGKNQKDIVRNVEYDLVTKMYPYGADGMDITEATSSGGLEYITNTDYTSEVYVKAYTFEESFDTPDDLYDAAVALLEKLAWPRYRYEVETLDLRTLAGYEHETFSLGDMADIVDEDAGLDIQERIVRHKYNVFQPWECDLELGELPLRYEKLISKLLKNKWEVDETPGAAPTLTAPTLTLRSDGAMLIAISRPSSTYLTGFNLWRQKTGDATDELIRSLNMAYDKCPVTLTIQDVDVEEGAEYYYWVSAYDSYGRESAKTATDPTHLTSHDTTAPTPPSSMTATGGRGTVALRWVPPVDPSIDHYQVWLSDAADMDPYTAVNVQGTTYDDYGRTTTATRYYRVYSVDAAGNLSATYVSASGAATVPADGVAPDAPTVTGIPGANPYIHRNGRLLPRWNPSTAADANAYRVVRHECTSAARAGDTATDGGYVRHVVTSAGYGLEFGNLKKGAYYYFSVYCIDNSGMVSAELQIPASGAVAAVDTTAPSTPTNLTATGATGAIILEWSEVNATEPGIGYQVWRMRPNAPYSEGTYTQIALIAGVGRGSATKLRFTDTGPNANKTETYYYMVCAVDEWGNVSSFTDAVNATSIVANGTATFTISDGSTTNNASRADFMVPAGSTSAQTTINTAITTIPGSTHSRPGKIVLLEGTFIIDGATIFRSGLTIEGQGDSTILYVKNSCGSSFKVFENSDTSSGNTGLTLRNLVIDGNKANNTGAGIDISGVYFDNVDGLTIENVRVRNADRYGAYLKNIGRLSITNLESQDANSHGVAINTTTSTSINVRGITGTGNGSAGMYIANAHGGVYSDITANENEYGFYLYNSTGLTVNNIEANDNNYEGVRLSYADNNNIRGIRAEGNSQITSLTYSNVRLSNSDKNSLQQAMCRVGTDNLVTNEGFEALTGGWADDWSRSSSSKVTVSSAEAKDGTYSCKIDDDSAGSMVYAYRTGIAVTPGEAYTLYADAKMVTGWQYLRLKFIDGSTNPEYDAPATDTDWDRIIVQGVAPAGATSIEVYILGGTADADITFGYWDNVFLNAGKVPTWGIWNESGKENNITNNDLYNAGASGNFTDTGTRTYTNPGNRGA
ncbi:MAG: phage tail protein [Bacteroidales bacterium]|nr:phage tail protein [Bacteroidales bacterium]